MRWTATTGDISKLKSDLIIIPLTSEKPKGLSALDKATGSGLTKAASLFKGKLETTHLVPGGRSGADWVLLVGLGKGEEVSVESIRRCAALAAKRAKTLKAGSCTLKLPVDALKDLDSSAIARCWVEGAELALFEAGLCKSKKEKAVVKSWKLVADKKSIAKLRAGLREGESYAAGSLVSRKLVTLPPNHLTPVKLAAEARKVAKTADLKCTVLGAAKLKQIGAGGIIGVGQGSVNESKLIILESKTKRKNAKSITLVGKGVTFDTGGISLKPGANMHEMKGDMGGAAAMLGAALIVSRLKMRVNLKVIIPAVENMPDGNAIKPGDVLKMLSGKTVEVLNTDAEGRLILADGLHLACKDKPDFVIDAATLTGACAIALGTQFAGTFSNSSVLAESIDKAGCDTFERSWPMPLTEEHHADIVSSVADIKNLGKRYGGASSAAAFLEEFVDEDVNWAHIDIAGPSWLDASLPYCAKGGSGFGARLIARTLQILTD
ncbi:MAG: leucyl aminopeptidase [bacterium]|nr:leucyl aminopeptidase [bacterium]MCP4799571.1 leucyl aminopeptidase [bacterium]